MCAAVYRFHLVKATEVGLAESNGSLLRADCLCTGIISGPNARYLTFYLVISCSSSSNIPTKVDLMLNSGQYGIAQIA